MIYYVSHTPSLSIPGNVAEATIGDALNYFRDHTVIQVDTETTGLNFLDDRIILLQLGDRENQYVINAEVGVKAFKPILEDRRVLKILQNARFDYKFLKKAGITLENVYDTMLVEMVINGGKDNISYSLDSIVMRYLGFELSKEIRDTFKNYNGAISNAQIVYGANDVKHLEDIRDAQLEVVQRKGLENTVWLENNALLALADIEYNGMAIDKPKWLSNSIEALKEILSAELLLDRIILDDPKFGMRGQYYQQDMFKPAEETRKTEINWNSPFQVLQLMQKVVPELTSVGTDAIYKFRKRHQLIPSYLDYKKKQKLYTSYGPGFLDLIYSDGRVHTQFRQILNTGRISSSSPNMQQVPATNEYRNCFIPGIKDYLFVSSDYSSQELAVIAYGSGDPVWLEALQNRQDLHSVCAELIFGSRWAGLAENDCSYYHNNRSKCECPEHKKLRTFAKTLNFGLAYGMSSHKLSDRLEIPIEEADDIMNRFFSVFPKIRHFLENLGKFGTRNGYILTFPPFKRIRYFDNWSPDMDNRIKGEIERASKNTPIQGSSADMTKLALIYVRDHIEKRGVPVKLVMTVHDQIDTIVHKDYADEWSKIFTELMEKAALKIVRNGLLKAETNKNEVWKK